MAYRKEYETDIPEQVETSNSIKKFIVPLCVLAVCLIGIVTFFGIKMMRESMPVEPEVIPEPEPIVQEVVEEPLKVDYNSLLATLPWEDDYVKVEAFKQLTLSDYPEVSIGEMFQNEESVVEWKYAPYESGHYFLCHYMSLQEQKNQVVFVQQNQQVEVVELYVDDIKQIPNAIATYCELMFTLPHVYIFPDSAERYLLEEEVRALDLALLKFARNEIFARRGKIFEDGELSSYFEAQSWYEGIAKEVYLSELETANVRMIRSVETGAIDFDLEQVNGTVYVNGSSGGHELHFTLKENKEVLLNIYAIPEGNLIAENFACEVTDARTLQVKSQAGGKLTLSWLETDILTAKNDGFGGDISDGEYFNPLAFPEAS